MHSLRQKILQLEHETGNRMVGLRRNFNELVRGGGKKNRQKRQKRKYKQKKTKKQKRKSRRNKQKQPIDDELAAHLGNLRIKQTNKYNKYKKEFPARYEGLDGSFIADITSAPIDDEGAAYLENLRKEQKTSTKRSFQRVTKA